MEDWLIQLVNIHPHIVYAIIVVIACIEGPILSMIGGVLIKLNYFSLLPMYIALMFGDLIGDVIWYYIGYFYGHKFINRFGKYFNITEESIAKVIRIFHKYKNRILIISKITNGFGLALATLMTAGMVKIPFWKYISINIIGQFIWTGLLLSIGYLFGNLYITVNSALEKVCVAVVFIIVFIMFLRYKKYLSERAKKTF